MKMEQNVPKRRHIKFRRREITQKKAYNIRNTAKVWNQELICGFGETKLDRLCPIFIHALTFELTLKSWEGRLHCTVNSEVIRHDK